MVSTRALETAYLHEFWTFLVLGAWGAFLCFCWVPKTTPLEVSVLGGLASEPVEIPGGLPSEPVEMPEPERTGTGGTRFGTRTVGTGTSGRRNGPEPNRTVPFLEIAASYWG